jgi:hypothetical protein
MIDTTKETLTSFSQAARRLPPFREGRPVSASTLFRWATKGVRLSDGSTLRLEAIRIGGRWLTSTEALDRFVRRQTPDFTGISTSDLRTPGQRNRASERAAAELEAAGI